MIKTVKTNPTFTEYGKTIYLDENEEILAEIVDFSNEQELDFMVKFYRDLQVSEYLEICDLALNWKTMQKTWCKALAVELADAFNNQD